MKRITVLVLCCLLLLLFASVSSAQIKNTGAVLGRVTDQTGAVIPNVTVTLRNVDTGAVLRAQSDGSGDYSFPVVPVGKYELTVGGAGFKTSVLRDISVSAVENVRLNPMLQIGDVVEQVTVEAAPPAVNSVTADLGDTVVGKQIETLPISSRLFTQLIFLEPGVVSNNPEGGGGFGSNSVANFSLNGVRSDQNNMQIDGIRNLDTFGGNAFVSPNLNSLQEFRIENNSYSAATGRSAGGQINLITRSGTNGFHGSVFEYFRNDKLNARNFFASDKPENRYNNFGYTIGGPVKKDKLFFFWSQEWRRIIQSGGTRTATVATPAERLGDFSSLLPDRVIKDPDTGQPYPNNVIPTNKIDPNAQLLLNTYFPQPNFQSGGTLNFTASNPDTTFWREESARVDYRATNKLSFFARFTGDSSSLKNPFELFGGNVLPNVGASIQEFPIYNGAFNATYTPTASFIGEFRWGFYKANDKKLEHTADSNRDRAPGLNIPELFPFNAQNRIPGLGFAQGYAGISLPWPFHNYAYGMPFEGHLTWIKGAHTIRWGIGIMREGKGEVASATGNLTNGAFNFDGSATGDALADFMVGRAFSYTETATDPFGVYRWVNVEPYAEDQIKVKRNVTLTLGVRYTYFQPEVEKVNLQNFFDPTRFDPSKASVVLPDGTVAPGTENVLNGLVQAGSPDNPFGRSVVNSDKSHFAPRLGLVWDPSGTGKMAVRLGYGVFYDRWGSYSQFSSTNPPFTQSVQVFNTLLSHPGQRPGGGASEKPIYPVNLRTETTPWKYPYVQKWSAGLQYELGHAVTAEATYVGTKGTHLLGVFDMNQINPNPLVANGDISPNYVRPFPGYGGITTWATDRNSTYHGLQTSLRRRVGAGLAFQASYTLSKTLTDASDSWGTPQDSRNIRAEKGLASFDATHVFVANYLWDVPLGRDSHGVAKAVLAGWQVSGITRFQSGSPLTVFAPGDTAGIGTGGQRPNLIADPSGSKSFSQWFNTNAFAIPAPLTFGNAGVGIIRGPGINNWDFAVYKMIPMGTERVNTQFRAQFFNAFNHTQFSGVDTGYGSGSFGQIVGARSPRVIQLGLELHY
jgi:hypothetical protein